MHTQYEVFVDGKRSIYNKGPLTLAGLLQISPKDLLPQGQAFVEGELIEWKLIKENNL